MERKTHYMVLGVSRAESLSGIRARYRDLAKKLHPDVAGEQATRAFQEVSEAFNVLSDPERRREYNRELSRNDEGDQVAVVHGRRSRPRSIVRDPVTMKSAQVLDFEVLLTPEEAWHGCVVPVGVPVFRRCAQCGGSGRSWASSCASCRQNGLIETEAVVRVSIPSLVPPGSVFELPLGHLGIDNLRLRLHVFVET